LGPDGEMEIKNEIMGVEKLLVFCGSSFFLEFFIFEFLMMKKSLKKASKLGRMDPKTQQYQKCLKTKKNYGISTKMHQK
jgi:hypothetical protein